MEIVSIFAPYLYAVEYDDSLNEYELCMAKWMEADYLRVFARDNGIANVNRFILSVENDIEMIQDILKSIGAGEKNADLFFRPLHDTEYKIIALSLQKGKLKKSYLRLYAIKVGEGVFVITGGAIKIQRAMQDQVETARELEKINRARRFLVEKGVGDIDSFYEFLND